MKLIHNKNYRRYFVTLVLSTMIFVTGFLASNTLTNKKLENLRTVEDNISLSILSSETEYDIMQEISCENLQNQTILTKEIGDLAEKLQILESNDENDTRIIQAKKRYSLLLIKDFLLSKRLNENCGTKPTFIIYFYGNRDICPNCVQTGIALDALRNDFEKLRVYAFDMNLDMPLIESFATLYGIKQDALPAIVINKKVYGGLTTKDAIEKLLPKEIKEKTATTSKRQSLNYTTSISKLPNFLPL